SKKPRFGLKQHTRSRVASTMPCRNTSSASPGGTADGSGSRPTHSHELLAPTAACRRFWNEEVRKSDGPAALGVTCIIAAVQQGAVTNMLFRAPRALSMLAAAAFIVPPIAACQPAAPAAQPTTAPTTAPAKPTTAPAPSPSAVAPAASPAATPSAAAQPAAS